MHLRSQSVGGQLEMDKNDWYLIEWNFDSNESPYIKEQTHPLSFIDESAIKFHIKNFSPTHQQHISV